MDIYLWLIMRHIHDERSNTDVFEPDVLCTTLAEVEYLIKLKAVTSFEDEGLITKHGKSQMAIDVPLDEYWCEDLVYKVDFLDCRNEIDKREVYTSFEETQSFAKSILAEIEKDLS